MIFGGYLLRKYRLSTTVKNFYTKFFDPVSILIPRLFFILFIFFVPEIYSDSIAKDELFREFLTKLSTDWKVKFEKEEMIFERIEPIYVLPTNLEEKKVEFIEEEKKIEKFKKYGMRLKPLLKYKFAKKRKVKEEILAITKKENFLDEISKIRIKYKIDSIVNLKKSNPEIEIYEPKTKTSKTNLKKFLKEKEVLEKKIPLFPDYNFRNYFITLVEKKGMKTVYKDIYPESVVNEFLEIEKILLPYKAFRQEK